MFGARVLEFFVVASGADNLAGQRGRGRLCLRLLLAILFYPSHSQVFAGRSAG